MEFQNNSSLTFEKNHEPEQQGIWFPYTGFRYKDFYDIELHDGRVFPNCRPNGDSWLTASGLNWNDSDVAKVRLKPDDEIDNKWHFKGQARIDYLKEL